ncbi:MAG TPA: hypothetical protein VEX38_04910, partial [Fimbriimonadaceae bacterium]|nr:hypothetical protein [Fimbriimonadaceae bacterium]
LPGVLVGLAITMRLRRYRVRWSWHALFWSLLAGYLILRGQLLPTDVSGYQSQQFRSGDGVWITILGYLFPAGAPFTMGVRALEPSVLVLFTPLLYEIVLKLAGNIVSYVAARRHWILAAAAWSLSTVALLPMAWLHHFDHYHFWPMAIRALFVSVLVWSLLDLWVIAASRRVVQAPLRLSPAPGSLPRQ